LEEQLNLIEKTVKNFSNLSLVEMIDEDI